MVVVHYERCMVRFAASYLCVDERGQDHLLSLADFEQFKKLTLLRAGLYRPIVGPRWRTFSIEIFSVDFGHAPAEKSAWRPPSP